MEDLVCAIKSAKDLGYRQIKLYFMIGLPTETDRDLDGIVDLVCSISRQNKIKITLSISNFLPKPHTPFQWLNMDSIENLQRKQRYIKSNIRRRDHRIKINSHDVYMSYLECIFSRGDRKLSEVILNAFNNGARFDSWSSDFDFNRWIEAFKMSSIDPDFYCRRIKSEEILPWDHIDIGIGRDSLASQLDEVLNSSTLTDSPI